MSIQAFQRRSLVSVAQNNTTENLTLKGALGRFSALLVAFFDQIIDSREQSRTQMQLESLSDRALDDIGLSRGDVVSMVRKHR
jgi:uncharacterized protein YjiS (DUF1127 family)